MELAFPSIHPAFKKKDKQKCKQKGTHKNFDCLFALTALALCWVLPDNNDLSSSSVCLEEYCMFSRSDG